MGGSVAGHKGYGLALAAALLGGLAIIDDPAPNTAGTSSPSTAEAGWTAGVFLLLLDPASFGDPPRFAEMVASTLDNARSLPCAPGFESVVVAGDPERRNRQRRASEGIEIPPATWQELGELAIRFGVSLPGES